MIQIRYRNEKTLGDMVFPDDFWFNMYIDTVIERPEYPIIEEAEEDQAGDMHINFQRYSKQRRLRFFAVESLCDAVSTLPLMDYVEIGGSRVFDITVDVRWEEDLQCLANIELSFNYKSIVKTL
jgi:hypothetical protein